MERQSEIASTTPKSYTAFAFIWCRLYCKCSYEARTTSARLLFTCKTAA